MKQHMPDLWNSRMSELHAAYAKHFMHLDGDTQGRLAAQGYLNSSTALYHGEVVGMGYLPKLYDAYALDAFGEIVATTYSILDKMTRHFIADAEYRALFKLTPLMERLILLPNSYDCSIPIARFDIFLDEERGNFKFCEFNTDGSSAMNEDREICDALALTPVFKRFNAEHRVEAQELFDPWVECFLDIYQGSAGALPAPVVAIVDYMASAAVEEQLEFRTRFAHYGINCLVVDVASLEYRDGTLYGRDISEQHPAHLMPLPLDAIYRRAVTSELLVELNQTPAAVERILDAGQCASCSGALALLAAVANQKVCMIGSFQSQVAHSKASFCLLHHPKTWELLSESERSFIQEHAPYTTWLKENCIDVASVKAKQEKWIIKPVDGYGSKGVQAGKSLSAEEWSVLIDEKLQDDYIIQEYCAQYQTLNTLPVPLDKAGVACFDDAASAAELTEQGLYRANELQPYNILTGLFSYGGVFAGVYVRSGQDALIVGFRGGVTLASFLVDTDLDSESLPRPRRILK